LLVEDEASVATTLTDRLTSEGYAVESAPDGTTGLFRAVAGAFDLVILDVMLPGRSGFDVCRELRRRGSEVPVLMLTARDQVVDKVLGLGLGADDYVTKPFDVRELVARVESLLRRARMAISPSVGSYVFGAVEVDFRRGEVRKDGSPVDVSALEFKLLAYLIEHRGALVSRDQILSDVWGYESMPYSRTVDVHIASLRQKVEPDPHRPRFIMTRHGRGYMFVS
jgi:two-component system alkaline phosphatase synthesis response regulator PhoP